MDSQENIRNAPDRIQQEIYRKMSFTQKWEITCRLRETAWLLKMAGVRSKRPELSEQEVEAEVRKIFLYAST